MLVIQTSLANECTTSLIPIVKNILNIRVLANKLKVPFLDPSFPLASSRCRERRPWVQVKIGNDIHVITNVP